MGSRVRADPRYKPLPVEPATLLTEGKLAEAVEVLRRSHGLRRREARAWIDWHLSDDPILQAQIQSQERARRRRIFFWVYLIDILIAAGIIYYLFYRAD